jgi:N-acylneuraminate cytidylyltransferase
VKDKYAFLTNFALERKIDFGAIAYVGDDVNDLSNLCRAGWSFAPYNATKQVLNHVDIVLNNSSGNGAIREVCEFLINYNNRY